jgi:hypothetical protein
MIKRLLLLVTTAGLAACSSLSGDYGLVVEAISLSRQQVQLPTFSSGLNSRYRYLAVHPTGGTKAVFILGFESITPQGLSEVWYSADGVMLQTLNGRIAATRGYPFQWASVSWHQQGTALERSRDDLSAGVFSVVDSITTRSVGFSSVPPHAWASWVTASAAVSQLIWVQDDITTQPATLSPGTGWVAHGTHRGANNWVFSHQCLNAGYCFSLARWPLEVEPPQQ